GCLSDIERAESFRGEARRPPSWSVGSRSIVAEEGGFRCPREGAGVEGWHHRDSRTGDRVFAAVGDGEERHAVRLIHAQGHSVPTVGGTEVHFKKGLNMATDER